MVNGLIWISERAFKQPMEPSIIISAIAVGVSVLSVAANVYTARKSARVGLESTKFKAELDRADTSSKSLKEIETEAERLRIRGWELMVHALHLPQSDEQQKDRFAHATKSFLNQANTFLEVWAEAKSDVPETVIQYLRSLRHDCRHLITAIRTYSEFLGTFSGPRQAKDARRCAETIGVLLKTLDDFITAVGMVRRSILRGDESDPIFDFSAVTRKEER